MKVFHYIALFILALCLFLSLFFLYSELMTETKEFKPLNVPSKTEEVYTNSSQFYPNMRYPDRKISFNISRDCVQNKENDIIEAFSILSRETVLEFYQTNSLAEIEVSCSNLSPRPEDREHYIAGEGGPKDIISAGNYYVITSGSVSLFRDEKCNEPKIAIHEILHALGFNHNNNPKSILYPITSCDEEIDAYVIDQINKLYSVDSLPDLAIIKANAEKTGKYLNFRVEIMNQGLKDASDARLNIYANDELVKEFEIGDIGIGIKKIVEVENLKIPGSSNRIEFYADSLDTRELSKDNNQAILNIVQ